MTALTNTTTTQRRPAGRTGDRVELARYTIIAGTRVLLGQRVNGTVRFLPTDGVVLVPRQGLSENDACRCRGIPTQRARADAVRRKRPNGTNWPHLPITGGAS